MKPGITLSRILVNEALIQLKIAAFNRVFTGVSTPYFDRLHFSLKPDEITAGIQPMRISFPLSPTSSAVWLASFFSPTLYFLLLLIVERLQLDPLPENIIILLFCLIPLVALLSSVNFSSGRPAAMVFAAAAGCGLPCWVSSFSSESLSRSSSWRPHTSKYSPDR